MTQKTCAEIIAEAEEKIKNSPALKAACEYSDSVKEPTTIYGFGKIGLIEAFQAGVEWALKNKTNSRATCLRNKTKTCNLCHECDTDVLNPNY